jgi:hypothetical protein
MEGGGYPVTHQLTPKAEKSILPSNHEENLFFGEQMENRELPLKFFLRPDT